MREVVTDTWQRAQSQLLCRNRPSPPLLQRYGDLDEKLSARPETKRLESIRRIRSTDEGSRRGSDLLERLLHALRHTAATLMRQQRISPELAAKRLGHGDGGALLLSTYNHVSDDALRGEMDRVGSLAPATASADGAPPTSARPPTALPLRTPNADSRAR